MAAAAVTTSTAPLNNTSPPTYSTGNTNYTNPKYYMTSSAGPSPPETPLYTKSTLSQTPPSATNISPTSITSGCNVRQLRQPRQPMYVPAALRPPDRSTRPTDIPARPRPLDTPPASKENSFDSGKLSGSPRDTTLPWTDAASQAQDGGDMDALRRSLSIAGSEVLEDDLTGDVTGPPTTAHWKPDGSADACYICSAAFTWYFRRHHCRRCGQLVCDSHIRHVVPLDQNARYHPKGTASKACNTCWNGWKVVKKLQQHSRTGSIASSSNSSAGTAMPIPNNARPSNDFRVGSMARSEGGMVWSTF